MYDLNYSSEVCRYVDKFSVAEFGLEKFSDRPDLLTGSLQACVGPAAGVELNAFISNLDQMPDLEAIVNGDDIAAPKEIDLQYAVASALVGHAIRAKKSADPTKVHGNILNYANRFPQREMGVMMVSDMHRAIGEDIFSLPEFAAWADKIADIMIFDHA